VVRLSLHLLNYDLFSIAEKYWRFFLHERFCIVHEKGVQVIITTFGIYLSTSFTAEWLHY